MIQLASALVCFFFACSAFALNVGETLAPLNIENQFGESVEVSESTQQIIFAADKPASQMLTEFMNANAASLDLSKIVIVSDISKMPALISKMIAIPKMKKYSFKMALDKSGNTTQSWPRQEGQLTVLTISNKTVSQISHLATSEDLKSLLKNEAAAQ